MPFLPTPQLHTRKIRAIRLSAFFAAIIALIFVGGVKDACAQSSWYWRNGNGSGSWSTSLNGGSWWNGSAQQLSNSGTFDAMLTFDGSSDATQTNDATGAAVRGIQFLSGRVATTIGGNLLKIGYNGTGKIENASSNTQTINFALSNAYGNGLEMNAVNGSLLLSDLYLGSSATVNLYGSNNNTLGLRGLVSGSATINWINSRDNRVVFSASNSMSGTLNVNRGYLIVSNASATLGSSTINIGESGQAQFAELQLGAGGTAQTNALGNNIVINSESGNSGANRSIASANTSGTNTITGTVANNSGIATKIYIASGGTLRLSNVVSGTGGFYLEDISGSGGTLELSAANTFSGGVFADSGTVKVSGSTATVGSGTLALGKTVGSAASALLYSGTGGGITLTNSSLDVRSGSGGRTVASEATSGTNIFTGAVNLANTLTISNANGGEFRVTGVISNTGALTKSGAGVLVLTASNTYTGATTIGGGTLRLSASNRISDSSAVSIASQATFDLNSFNETVGSIAGAGNISLGSGILTAGGDNSTTTASGTISGSGGVVKTGSGILTLSGANTYGGSTTINSGTLQITNDNNLGTAPGVSTADMLVLSNTTGTSSAFVANETFTLNANRGLTFVGSNSGNQGTYFFAVASGKTLTYNGVIAGSGNLVQNQAGTLVLGGNSSSYTGGIFVDAGTVEFSAGSLGSGTVIGLGAGGGANNATFTISGASLSTARNIDVRSGSGLRTINFANASGNSTISGNVTNGNTLSVVTTSSGTLAGTISGGGSIAKSGAGSLVLSGNSSGFAGGISIDAGTLVFSAGDMGGSGQALALGDSSTGANNATFAMSGDSLSTGRNVDIRGGAGSRTLNFNNSLGTTNAISGTISHTNKAFTINVANSGATALLSGVITNTSGGPTISITGNGTVALANTGNTTDARWNIGNGATLAIGASRNLGADAGYYIDKVTLAGGTLRITNSFQLSGFGIQTTNASAISVDNGVVFTNPAVMGGTANLTKSGSGSLVLSAANTNTGKWIINQGVISVSAASNLGVSPGAVVADQLTLNGGTLAVTTGFTANANAGLTVGSSNGWVDIAANQRLVQVGGLSGSGVLTKTGLGTLSLTNTPGTYAATATVTNGTLQVNTALRGANVNVGNSSILNGSVLMGAGQVGSVIIDTNGRISPGNSVGILSVSNSLTFNGGGSYLWEITNAASGSPGTNWDLITVDTTAVNNGLGTLTIGSNGQFTVNGDGTGIANFTNNQSYTNDYFLIVRAANISGSLANLAFSGTGLGTGAWTFSTNSTGLFLNYTAPGTIWTFTNSVAADQGTANTTTNGNTLNQLATITNEGAGVTAVIISNSAPITFTNGNNSYSGTTIIEQGTLVAGVNAPNAANGAFGNAATAVQVGSTNTGNSTAATLLIGNSGVTVGRAITVNSGGAGARTIGATNASGTATYSGNIAANTNVTLSASNTGGTTLFSGVLSGSGAITAAGSGTVVLAGANSYTNATTVNSNATLIAANNSALGGGSGATTVASGGTLAFSNNINEDEAITISGVGVGGLGALRNLSGANTNTGTVSLGSLTNLIAADAGSTLTLSSIDTVATSNNLTVSANGTVRVLGSILTAGSITNVLQKDGTGSLVFSNNGTTGGIQLQVGNGAVTLAAGSLSTNTSTTGSTTSPRAIDLGIGSAGDSTNNVAFYANGGVTVSNSFYVAPNTNNATRTIGTESTSGTATFNSEIYLGGNAHLTAASGGTAWFSGNFVNNGSLVKVGTGTVLLSGNNSIGNVTISNGTLAISNGVAIPSTSLLTIDGGATLSVLSTENVGRMQGTGTVSVASGAILTNTLTTSSSFGGLLTGSGTIQKAGTGSMTLTGGTSNSIALFVHEAGVLLAGTNTGLASVYQVDFNNTNDVKTIAASGAGNFTLSQSNNIYNDLTLGEATGNTGKLTFSGGTFLGNEVGQTRTLTVAANNNHEFSGPITGNRGIIKAGTGSLTLSGNNTFGNTFQLNDGTVLVGNNAALGAGVFQVQFSVGGTKTIAANGTNAFTLSQSNNIYNDLTIGQAAGNTGSLTFGGGTFLGDTGGPRVLTVNGNQTFSGTVTGANGLTKAGDGTLVLSGSNANTFAGATTITAGVLLLQKTSGVNALAGTPTINSGGTLRLGASDQFAGDSTFLTVNSGGTFDLNGFSDTLALQGAGNITLGSGRLTINPGSTDTFSGVISGTGSVIKTNVGTQILSGSNTYSGGTLVAQGTLRIGAGGTSGSVAGDITNNGTVTFNRSDNITFGGVMSGTGSLQKWGAGTLTLSGANTVGGADHYLIDGTTLFTVDQGSGFTGNLNLGDTTGGNSAALAIGTSGVTITNPIVVRSGSSGTMTISALNTSGTATFSGATTLNKSVTLSANSGGNLSLGAVTMGNNSITYSGANNVTISGSMSATTSAAQLSVSGAGVMTLSGDNSASNQMKIILNSGTLSVGALSAFGTVGGYYSDKINFNGGTLSVTNDVAINADTFGMTTSANGGTINVAANKTFTQNAWISSGNAAGTFNKTGSGTLVLGASTNALNPTFNIKAGAVQVAAVGALGTNVTTLGLGDTSTSGALRYTGGSATLSQAISLAAGGGTIDVSVAGLGTTLTVTNVISGAGNTLTKAGESILALTNANTYGKTVISGGMLTVNADSGLGASPGAATADSVTIGNARLGLNGNFTLGANRGITLTDANSTIDVYGGNSATVAGVITNTGSGALTKLGLGTLTLSGANLYSGNTTVGLGVLQIGASNNLGTGSAVTISNGATFVLSSAAGFDLARSVSLSGNGAVSGAFVSAGGANTNSGGIVLGTNATIGVSAGSLVLSGNVTNSGNTLTVDTYGVSGTPLTLSGVVSGSGGLTKIGGGTATLSGAGANTYAGPTAVNSGVLNLNKTSGVNAIAGSVSVASGATLLLSSSGNVADSSAVTLSGGTIRRGGNVSEVFGNLSLTAGSFLDYGAGNAIGTLSFGTYTPSSLLTVQNFLPGNVLTFGSNLTSSINNASLFNLGSQGFTSSWNSGTSTFTITAIPEPSTYVAAAGLLAMFLWPSRRRLIKDMKSILGLRAPARDRLAH